MKIVSVEEMRFMDHVTCQEFVDSRSLMFEAGLGVYREIVNFAELNGFSRFLVICGKGNNGGDGFVIANLLHEADKVVKVLSLYPISELKGDAKFYGGDLSGDIEFFSGFEIPEFSNDVVIVDAILGTGFSGELRTNYQKLIEEINKLPNPVISVDIPSGLNGDSGKLQPVAVEAEETVTIGYPKTGLFIADAPKVVGDLRLVKISIPEELETRCVSDLDAAFIQDVNFDSKRLKNGHKKSFGTIKVIGGSSQYQGAPKLSAVAAMRSGCGYVTLLTSDEVGREANPLALIHQQFKNLSEAEEFVEKGDVLVFGPGLGRNPKGTELLKNLLSIPKTLVLDADGLWNLCQVEGFRQFDNRAVLTPHPGEMKRLLERFNPDVLDFDRVDQAKALAEKLNAVVVLKGRFTVIADSNGKCSLNSSGCNALATAGTGDVLSGVIGALVAEGSDTFKAVETAVFVHGRAGELAISRRAMIADDLLELIPQVFLEIDPTS